MFESNLGSDNQSFGKQIMYGIFALGIASIASITLVQQAQAELSLTIRNDVAGNASFPTLYGYMYEDINHCGDGGLYAEMIRNRAFQMNDTGGAPDLSYYSSVNSDGSSSSINLDSTVPLNDVLTHTLRLDISKIASGGRVGFSNEGFWGIRVQPKETYNASFWAKSNNYTGPLTISLETSSGKVLANATISSIGSTFKQYSVTLSPSVTEVSIDNVFVISASSSSAAGSSIWFDVISLFPPTYKNRKNGLRADIAQILVDTKPSFFRFPGAHKYQFIENKVNISHALQDPSKIVPVALEVKTRTQCDTMTSVGKTKSSTDWGYMNTDGQGLLEYLEMCEDLNMAPLLAVWAGYSLNKESVPQADLDPYVQDTLNELEYIMGDASTTYGAMRVRDGHPEPFDLKYVEVGNEDFFSTTYDYRYKAWYDAIKKAYPDLQIIATGLETSTPIQTLDDHYYMDGTDMIAAWSKYDNYPRNGSTVMVGEYATNINGCCGTSPANVQAAVADAIFALGLERNSDLVQFAAYAPTFTRDGQAQWNPDLISFNTAIVWGTPSYYVQQMWSANRADTILGVNATGGGYDPLYWVAGQKNSTKQVFLKVANYGNSSQTIAIKVAGPRVHSQGVSIILTGAATANNTVSSSNNIVPKTSNFFVSSNTFNFTFPAWSASVLMLQNL
ncbi:hypothetical protein NQZ79_g2205 [Umbelopsis isabellina]|nr:hypothetical protein NQZ79_g2205 [Umbelopsis isabellina]